MQACSLLLNTLQPCLVPECFELHKGFGHLQVGCAQLQRVLLGTALSLSEVAQRQL
jgi:hypothetical protein